MGFFGIRKRDFRFGTFNLIAKFDDSFAAAAGGLEPAAAYVPRFLILFAIFFACRNEPLDFDAVVCFLRKQNPKPQVIQPLKRVRSWAWEQRTL